MIDESFIFEVLIYAALIIIPVVLLILWWRTYHLNTFDTVVAFTGGLGSGKSFLSVDTALRLLRRNRWRVWLHNLFSRKSKRWERPRLYSSIPVRISRKEWATELTDGHLLLQERITPRSVVFLDEIGGYCSQFDYKAVNSAAFDEFVRFFRHYTRGGYIVCNDQCSENIVLQVRRRLNTVYNLMTFRKWFFGRIYTVKVRNISISEEIKTVEEGMTEESYRYLFGFMPFFKRYDTHCYAGRYEVVPDAEPTTYEELPTLRVLRMSKRPVQDLDTRLERAFRASVDVQDAQKNELFEPCSRLRFLGKFAKIQETFSNLLQKGKARCIMMVLPLMESCWCRNHTKCKGGFVRKPSEKKPDASDVDSTD